MIKKIFIISAFLCFIAFSSALFAHFQVIIPTKDIISSKSESNINLSLLFTHPFNQYHMNMGKPSEFGVFLNGKKKNLLSNLKKVKSKGFDTYTANYKVNKPGDHIFYLVPKPYFEQEEGKFIVHNTKVTVNAFGLENGWAEEIGMDAEIIPLVRPYGLWSGNIFRGLVKKYGKVVPNAVVEVEYYNYKQDVVAPAPPFETQVVIADKNGVFSYAMPKSGWWGFSAIMEAKNSHKKDGKDYPVELGAVFWVKTKDMK